YSHRPQATTTPKAKRGSKSSFRRGKTPGGRKRTSCDETIQSPTSPFTPQPPPKPTQRPIAQPPQQPVGLQCHRSGPIDVRMTSAPPTSKEVANISQRLNVLGRMMWKMQATVERMDQQCE
ncbi:hypothetical protein KEM55_006471, partial [Ascosphaera atra]